MRTWTCVRTDELCFPSPHRKVITRLSKHSFVMARRQSYVPTAIAPLLCSLQAKLAILKLQVLLAGGADVNAINKYGVTPLSITSQQGHLDIVRELIAKDAHVDRASATGATPLYTASFNGHLDVVDYLIRSGADVNKGDIESSTPLFYAAQKGHLGVVKYLVLSGALPHLAKKMGGRHCWLRLRWVT